MGWSARKSFAAILVVLASAFPAAHAVAGPAEIAEADRLLAEAAKRSDAGEYAAALPSIERAIALREKALGKDHAALVPALSALAELYLDKGDTARAEPFARRALAIARKARGVPPKELARAQNDLARTLRDAGDYAKSEPLYLEAIATVEQGLGRDHLEIAEYLIGLSLLYQQKGEFPRAAPLLDRALAIRLGKLPPDHFQVGLVRHEIASLHHSMGDYGRAKPIYYQALAILEKARGPEHISLAATVNNLASLLDDEGDYARAEPLYKRALSILEKSVGKDHPNVAASLNNLALLYYNDGEYDKAEPLYARAHAIDEKLSGPDHPDTATSYNNMALLEFAKGDYDRAEQLQRRALAIREKALGAEHHLIANSYNMIARIQIARGDVTQAQALLERALAIKEKALGPMHPSVAVALHDIGLFFLAKGDLARAQASFERSYAIREKALGPLHPNVATTIERLATIYRDRGQLEKAETLYVHALGILEKKLGDHTDTARCLFDLTLLHRKKGDVPNAVATAKRAAAMQERILAAILAMDSDRAKLAYAAKVEADTWSIVSLHQQGAPADEGAARLALGTILRRKGRVLDATGESLAALRSRLGDDRKLLDDLAAARSQFAALVLRGAGSLSNEQYQAILAELQGRIERLEAEAGRRGGALRAEVAPVTVEAVEAALPRGSALVELFVYAPRDPAAPPRNPHGPARYAAYVLLPGGAVRYADLGPAAPIDEAVQKLRRALASPASDPKPPARALDRMIMGRVRPLLGDARWIFVSPDGALSLVPFGALADAQGRWLVERFSFDYLTSGRDLLRFRAADRTDAGAPAIVADPDFGSRGAAGLKPSGKRSIDMGAIEFPRLPGTAGEAEVLRGILPDARVVAGADATEAAVKSLRRPRVLHLATHGFFLPDRSLRATSRAHSSFQDSLPANALPPDFENPLLRSGLALAGANQQKGGGEDGILTALEVAGLDLHGTRLVVLSACETGLGEVRNGEGVLGLRRALLLAGAEAQVMSLWRVDDAATRDLMVAYYKDLAQGGGRAESLRQAQLALLDRDATAHPYYWSGFIASGNPASLEGKVVAPDFAKVPPGMRGCGCAVPGDTTGGGGAAVLGWIVLAALSTRKARSARGPRDNRPPSLRRTFPCRARDRAARGSRAAARSR